MELMRLPNELLEMIVGNVIPEGLESFALSCKSAHLLCLPFLKHHKELGKLLSEFRYYDTRGPAKNRLHYYTLPYSFGSAYGLISKIAAEPAVARYIQEADLTEDGACRSCGRMEYEKKYADCQQAVPALLANSTYLKQAGLDWKAYLTTMQNDIESLRYSHHATVFLLTLLPNVRVLRLPAGWHGGDDETNRLIDVIIRRARRSDLPYDRPSLGQLIKLKATDARPFNLNSIRPFAGLPRLENLRGSRGRGLHGWTRFPSIPSIPSDIYYRGNALRSVCLWCVPTDEVALTAFLKCCPSLETFTYGYSLEGADEFDLCGFVTVIGREVGSHLRTLCINLPHPECPIPGGSISVRTLFPRLERLELPIEIVTCNLAAAATTEEYNLDNPGSLLANIVPASVSVLSFHVISHEVFLEEGFESPQESDQHDKALDMMFRDFATWKESVVPVLEKISLTCSGSGGDLCAEQCSRLATEAEKVGVQFRPGPLHDETESEFSESMETGF